MVSDCITYSAREDYVKILEKFCNVTIIGSCNNKRAPDDWIWANKEIGRLVATLFRGHCNFVLLKLAVCGLLLLPWELSPQSLASLDFGIQNLFGFKFSSCQINKYGTLCVIIPQLLFVNT